MWIPLKISFIVMLNIVLTNQSVDGREFLPLQLGLAVGEYLLYLQVWKQI